MKLEEKIALLRKQRGWSQEELAFRLDVSRQAVSKWEMGASVPDLDKILKMSDLFGCTTDHLLKEDETAEQALPTSEEVRAEEKTVSHAPRQVTDEEGERYLDTVRACAKKTAVGVACCIVSPMMMFILEGLATSGAIQVSQDVAAGIGLAILFVICACGVAVLIRVGMALSPYQYLENTEIVISEELETLARERKNAEAVKFGKIVAIGVAACILSPIPMLIAGASNAPESVVMYCCSALFPIVAMGVYLFVRFGMIHGSYEKLLQEGDHTVEKKARAKNTDVFGGVYWCLVVALYLGLSFWTMRWDKTWIIFPVAGALFAALSQIVGAIANKKK
ncbi:MAG: helix-turn-helix transcriptional regulator [Clostridia bacterium]|nr:helix-turn-helix transcriptional regulator [Clostridia bacterium]